MRHVQVHLLTYLVDCHYFSNSTRNVFWAEKKRCEQTVLSNDELLYDPEMDDDDERWVNSQRQRYQPAARRAGDATTRRLPNSDAVLNCPACMSLLCLDCQRSEHSYTCTHTDTSVVVKTFLKKLETKTKTLILWSWGQDQDLGSLVSRPRPRPSHKTAL